MSYKYVFSRQASCKTQPEIDDLSEGKGLRMHVPELISFFKSTSVGLGKKNIMRTLAGFKLAPTSSEL